MEYINTYPKTEKQAEKHTYKYWDTQPVMRLNSIIGKDGIIEENLEKYGKINLNKKLYFKMDDNDYGLIAKFISKIYSNESIHPYYKYYSAEHIKYILGTDHICFTIRSKENDMILGLTLVQLRDYQINSNRLRLADVVFFTVIKKLRNKHLGSVMIKKLRDLLLEKGIKVGTFKTNLYIPKPFCTTRIHHRALNIKLLVNTNFTKLTNSIKLKNVQKELELPKEPRSEIYMLTNDNEEDINTAYNLLNESFKKYSIHPIFTKDEFKHIFINNKYVSSFVIRDTHGEIVDFCSYKRVLYNVKNSKTSIHGTQLYYYTSFETSPYRTIIDLMIIAKSRGSAVFSAYDIMGNNIVLSDLEFDKGGEVIHYNMYNYKLRNMSLEQVCYF